MDRSRVAQSGALACRRSRIEHADRDQQPGGGPVDHSPHPGQRYFATSPLNVDPAASSGSSAMAWASYRPISRCNCTHARVSATRRHRDRRRTS